MILTSLQQNSHAALLKVVAVKGADKIEGKFEDRSLVVPMLIYRLEAVAMIVLHTRVSSHVLWLMHEICISS